MEDGLATLGGLLAEQDDKNEIHGNLWFALQHSALEGLFEIKVKLVTPLRTRARLATLDGYTTLRSSVQRITR
ncbi:hypothetical protein E2C01_061147 [Portunus trituberculatus]|uniref:Uncharacterized protein n=1 Tax=Portunus trituberculatus TaxID=210409 RepID=A0A5B7HCF3_PORTR|nr:hypothetical protein [Portunus trituberculatus]